jgi:hypothetical protein
MCWLKQVFTRRRCYPELSEPIREQPDEKILDSPVRCAHMKSDATLAANFLGRAYADRFVPTAPSNPGPKAEVSPRGFRPGQIP